MSFSDVDAIRSGTLPIKPGDDFSGGLGAVPSWEFKDISGQDTVQAGRPAGDTVTLSAEASSASFPEITQNLNNYRNAGTDAQRYEAVSNLTKILDDPYLKADSPMFKALASIQD